MPSGHRDAYEGRAPDFGSDQNAASLSYATTCEGESNPAAYAYAVVHQDAARATPKPNTATCEGESNPAAHPYAAVHQDAATATPKPDTTTAETESDPAAYSYTHSDSYPATT